MKKVCLMLCAVAVIAALSLSANAGDSKGTWSAPGQTGQLIYDNIKLTNSVLDGNMTNSGTFADLGTVTTVDINGGTIDATVIGATTPTNVTTGVILNVGNLQTSTNGLVSGQVWLNSNVLTVIP